MRSIKYFLYMGFIVVIAIQFITIKELNQKKYIVEDSLYNIHKSMEAINPDSFIFNRLSDREKQLIIYAFAQAYNIEPKELFSLVYIESSFNSNATSYVGAIGLTQILPRTAKYHFEIDDTDVLFNPFVNLRYGCKYYSELLEMFEGDTNRALVAYNAGPTLARRVKYPELFPYVEKHKEFMDKIDG